MNFNRDIIDFSGLSETEIRKRLADLSIPLTTEEALKIQQDMLGRAPTLTELVLFSIEGSEHSSYKSSRSHLTQFVTDGPTVILGAKEDAGVVAVATDKSGHRWGVVMSHESHNHPSQIVPYEGAATGVGGNVRDVCCMGAEVIALADALRLGEINTHKTRWIHNGVVAGIAGYGNPLGIPNIGGDVYYNSGYNDNCLVNVVTLGILREDELVHSHAPQNADGYDLILVGKPTDNSGFGGASFASLELEEDKKEQNKGAVQEPNAFLERHLLKATYTLFTILKEKQLLNRVGFKDLGAGGIACASVELADAAGYGAEVDLDQVHVSMKNLHPSVILCSETQERFMWVSPPEITSLILDHYNTIFDLPGVSEGARASVIGKIHNDGQYRVQYQEETLVDAPAAEVTRGFLYDRPISLPKLKFSEPNLPEPRDYNQVLLKLLTHENIASREVIYEMYDKSVQGRSVIESGGADAGIMAPFNSAEYPEEIRSIGLALAVDHNPRYGQIDPYWAGVNAVVEAVSNVAATGAVPWALTDCLCFGNPEKPEQMWEFVEATRGVAEAAKGLPLQDDPAHPLPIVAGNVSFYNESRQGAIPASPIISCLGRLADVNKAITCNLQQTDSVLLMVGDRKDELGGSVYYDLVDEWGSRIPRPDLNEVHKQIQAVTDCIDRQLVRACHDISDGGIAVALAEMTFANNIGCKVEIPGELSIEKLLFTETGGFVLEVSTGNLATIKHIFSVHELNPVAIGKTNTSGTLSMNNVIQLSVNKARATWNKGLREKL